MEKTQFKSGQEIETKIGSRFIGEKSKGVVTGWVGYPKPNLVRVQWDNGDISDYLPLKLAAIIM